MSPAIALHDVTLKNLRRLYSHASTSTAALITVG